ncbi:altronate dehydratase family protein [Longimicrobium sp.]|uniref:UxaA family hydrolase n=1 Tax=Longimicrobium sp. TaxID=2029185 RepID=UPI002E313DA7|nr:altronate dehydratase family protein [Longimicrobium sp.]HEX6036900.1 altronate dehydratase family protein [Longimicrobium sp.]
MDAPLAVRIHPGDNVAVAVVPLHEGTEVAVDGARVTLVEDVPAGHKLALVPLAPGDAVTKYGFVIGEATAPVAAGAWVHSQNLRTRLSGTLEYAYRPVQRDGSSASAASVPTFMGYRRADGRVGTRNEVWIVNTVGCVNTAAERIARVAGERFAGRTDGVFSFSHPYGCSQLGDDLSNTQKVLAGLLRHPNAGGVLVLGLGCENNQMDQLLALAGDVDRERLRWFNTQDVVDEVEEGVDAVAALVARMEGDVRTECPASALILGHKCGGSDGFSGISANPLVGRIADRMTAMGGGVILTEVPEMFGAEQVLMNRAADEGVFRDIVAMINDFKDYFIRHDQPIYENPSPGNKAGGLTTLEEKSLGAIQKGGQATVSRVLRYGQPAATGGLSLLEAPGNDGVSSTAMVASGATVLLFTTGRGTPLGFPVPTIKISSNSHISEKKPHWIDFNAGALLDGAATLDGLADALFARILDVASGRIRTNNEMHGYREIAIWKEGVTL